MATNTIGSIAEFNSENEKITAYLERVQLFFEANGISDEKRVAVLLTVIGSTTYALLSNLVAPSKPKEKSFTVGVGGIGKYLITVYKIKILRYN